MPTLLDNFGIIAMKELACEGACERRPMGIFHMEQILALFQN